MMADSTNKKGLPVLKVQNLCIHLKNTPTALVNGISFELKAGETLALVGHSGAGKSLTAHSIMRLLPNTMNVRGSLSFYSHDNSKKEPTCLQSSTEQEIQKLRGNQISMIFQEPMTSLNPLHKIGKQIAEPLLQHFTCTKRNVICEVKQLLRDVELPDTQAFCERYPHELSGGQRQRIMIAQAIANCPKLLIADEPTTALDVLVEQQILALLQRLQQKYHMAILLISHDLKAVRRYAHSVCVMSKGKIVESNSTHKLFANPQHPVSESLIQSDFPEPTCPREGSEELLSTNQLTAWHKSRKRISLQFLHPKPAPVIENISLTLDKGETLGIVGESGSGKTTLGLALLRLLKTQGEICFQEQAINTLSPKEFRPLRKDIQIVFQDPFGSLNPRMTVLQILDEGLALHTRLQQQDRLARIQEILTEVQLPEKSLERYPHEFSGGQRQRIALARALVLRPQLIILDEPTSSLDQSLRHQLITLLQDLQLRHNISYIFISHDFTVIKALSHRVAVMKDGEIVECHNTSRIINTPQHPYTQSLIKAAFQ